MFRLQSVQHILSDEDSNNYGCFFVAVVPMLELKLGSNMNPHDIEEGDDVYFECNVRANPDAYKVVWKHNVSQNCFLLYE